MFLLTFVLVVISMLGVYTQVFAIETARLFAAESSIGQEFVTWHLAAASLAGSVVNPNNPLATPPGPTGCSVTPQFGVACTQGQNITGPGAVTVGKPPAYTDAFGNKYAALPQDYNMGAFTWKSLVFQSANCAYCVVTFVSASGASPIVTAGATPTTLNLTEADLYRQLQNLNIPTTSFGYVTNAGGVATLNAAPIMIGAALSPTAYTVPASIPNGALAILSFPGVCNAC